MEIILPIILGMAISAVGVALPGLINMTAAKISLNDGRSRAVIFAMGATTIVFIQTYIAVSFAKFINSHPDVINLLQEIGLGIFTVLTLYFLFFCKKPPMKKEAEDVVVVNSRTSRFFLGALLSALNFFPVPYYVFVSITLSTYNYFSFGNIFVLLFVSGATLGSFLMFYIYIVFFEKIKQKTAFFMKNINYIIGTITGLIAIVTFIRIIRNL
jgi:threonine/homoserine/homoserine lactone efflux protein